MQHKPEGANWVKTELEESRTKAQRALEKIKQKRKNKKFKLVKVCDHPPTYKEIEIKD